MIDFNISAKVVKVVTAAPKVRLYTLQTDKVFDFNAGQFIIMNLPIDDPVSWRSYSISSPPNNSNEFELCIANINGEGTQYIFDNIKKGSNIQISEPIGEFILPENITQDLCFICTGTGIAPIRSVLLDYFSRKMVKTSTNNVYLIFGARSQEDILYLKDWKRLEREYSNFKFIPTLSRLNDHWHGHVGYVHKIYKDLSLELNTLFFICGRRKMIKEAQVNLEQMGYKNIRYELYD